MGERYVSALLCCVMEGRRQGTMERKEQVFYMEKRYAITEKVPFAMLIA